MSSFTKKNISTLSFSILGIGILCLLVSAISKPDYDRIEELPIEKTLSKTSINQVISNENSVGLGLIDSNVNKFLKRWEINGASLAVVEEGKLIYAKGYGIADDNLEMGPNHILRVASLSKLITAAAIMKMQEDSLLSISDTVFGEDGLLPTFSNFSTSAVKKITVENLLRHEGGFSSRRGDPMFMVREIGIWEELDSVPTSDQIIEYCLKQRLAFAPGESTAYSNVGYLILSRIIEEISGMDYETYCKDNILHPAGCFDMHIGSNYYEDKFSNEVRYYEVDGAIPILSYDNSGEYKTHTYGGNDIKGLSGAGAWVSSPSEYARFIAHIDGNPQTQDLLSYETIASMLDENESYPIGWARGKLGDDWIRTGSLSGTSAVAKRYLDGSIWVFITNTSAWKGSRFTTDINNLIDECKNMESFPEQDLFSNLYI